ncbi:MAG: hypothetical protein ACRCYI_09960, partial [Plesiomonas shigelloides]
MAGLSLFFGVTEGYRCDFSIDCNKGLLCRPNKQPVTLPRSQIENVNKLFSGCAMRFIIFSRTAFSYGFGCRGHGITVAQQLTNQS